MHATIRDNLRHLKAVADAGGGGRKPMTRSEAARHASLVRWKKEQPLAANVQQRLAEIRAKRLKKGKGGGKGKAKGKAKGAKPKDARTPQEKANQNRAAISKETGMADLEGPLVRLGKGTLTDFSLERGAHDELIKKGLARRLPSGKPVLTPAGKKFRRAADKGDADGARSALAEGEEKAGASAARETERQQKKAEREQKKAEREMARAERTKQQAARKQEREKAKAERAKKKKAKAKAKPEPKPENKLEPFAPTPRIDIPGLQPKAKKSMDELQAVLDELTALRDEAREIFEDDAAATKAGRRNAAGDQAKIDQIYELAMELCDIAEALGADTGEEMEEAEVEGDEMEGKAAGGYLLPGAPPEVVAALAEALKAQRTFGGKERDDLDDADFAGPGRTFPIMTAADVKDAASLIGKAENPEAVKRKIIAIAKRKGFADALPEAWKEETKKSLDDAFVLGDAVKALDGGGVGALAVRFGSPDEPDMSVMRDYFTKSTDFWLDAWDRRPMLYHHAMDEDTSDAPRIGTWTKAEVKDEGIWLEGQLDRSHRYYTAIKELIKRGALRLSSDSAPHLVRRSVKGDTHEVTRWPIIGASLTPTPAEPRLTAVSFKAFIAELGIDDTDNPEAQEDAGERSDETKAQDDRTRKLLLLELELLDLEATIT